MPVNKDIFILDNKDKIEDFMDIISQTMANYIKSSKHQFVLLYKYLTHSDLATFGKATQVNSLDKNLLYYMQPSEMLAIEQKTLKPFQTTHQSCIGLKKIFYDKIGLPNPRDVDPYLINDYMNVYLVNDTLTYFTPSYTKHVFEKLNKNISERQAATWNFDKLKLNLSNDKFTPLKLHIAVHGIGMEQDLEFHKLRHFMFKGDTFILLYENATPQRGNLFIILEKNPVFFSILGLSNKAYENYQKTTRDRLISQVKSKENAATITSDVITRQQQGTWRQMLAKEMMGYTQINDQVFCPFTYITANFNELGALFVASHIKGFSDENTTDEEKYDINNGLLLCANADALFDKHLITINENKELVFSFLLENDEILKNRLLLTQPIFQPILNDKRMKYLAYHRHVFEELEIKRKTTI